MFLHLSPVSHPSSLLYLWELTLEGLIVESGLLERERGGGDGGGWWGEEDGGQKEEKIKRKGKSGRKSSCFPFQTAGSSLPPIDRVFFEPRPKVWGSRKFCKAVDIVREGVDGEREGRLYRVEKRKRKRKARS